jgi:hypothetical protein
VTSPSSFRKLALFASTSATRDWTVDTRSE